MLTRNIQALNILLRCWLLIISVTIFFCLNTSAQLIGTAIIHDKLGVNDSTMTNKRMRLDAVVSSCALPKIICPGYFGNSGVYYKTYCYTNESSGNECISVTMYPGCLSQIFCAAYIGSFDPTDVCSNYLADPGLSIANGGSVSMSFEVPSGTEYCVVVSAVYLGDTCESYTLKIAQYATSWHGSISNIDSAQTHRIHLDGNRNTCQSLKQLCANSPVPGVVNYDGYIYKNETPNDICMRATLYHQCSDSLSTITSVAYLNSFDSTDVCFNIAADAGVRDSTNDSLWYTFLVPAGNKCIITVYSQKDSIFCDDYVLKLESDFTSGFVESNTNTSSFVFFPNPVAHGGDITIRFNDNEYELMEVFDITARKIFSKYIMDDQKQWKLPASTLNKGMYILKLSGGEKAITQKFIVE